MSNSKLPILILLFFFTNPIIAQDTIKLDPFEIVRKYEPPPPIPVIIIDTIIESIPTDLIEALDYLEIMWSDSIKQYFKEKSEIDAVAETHFGAGLYIRNNWGLWEGKNSLVEFFNSLGIYHPDDMSGIILTSFHRKLNKKEIHIEEQIREYINYWLLVDQHRDSSKKISYIQSKILDISDTVEAYFDIEPWGNQKWLRALENKELKSKEKIELTELCKIKGVIISKDTTSSYHYINLKIIEFCELDSALFGLTRFIKLGDEINYCLSNNIQIVNHKQE